MRCLVTGAAGFIGSSLTDDLLKTGNEVIGIDCFVPYYAKELKDKNLTGALEHDNFTLIEKDLCDIFDSSEGEKVLDGIDVIFHQAAQAGVRASWGKDFSVYTQNNILGTQKLLESCRKYPNLKVVYASSSSVYGETDRFPMTETDLPKPVSPYGVSKLAAEHLMNLYQTNYGVNTSSLRYFTVYGPRQRPDMAFHRIIKSVLTGEEFRLFGTGEQTRDFTFISDIVQANIDCAALGKPGEVYNVGGGNRVSMNEVIKTIEDISGHTANVKREGKQLGDVTNTGANVEKAQHDFNYAPKVDLSSGLAQEIQYIKNVVLPLYL